jgi:membrane carboxypeptidase/penicillin-binding protein
MEAILVKVFAIALALSQVTTRPDSVKSQFDPATDKAEVAQLLNAGCTHIRKSFDLENIDLDDLIATVMTDKQAVAGEIAAFKGIKFDDLHAAYKQVCKGEKSQTPVVDIGELIEFYNRALADLPDHNRLKDLRLPGMTTVFDAKGARFAEVFEPDNRRRWVPLAEIPEHVQKAFIAAEDKRFHEHRGVDERSVIRAFINMVAEPSKRQGGSTITQQVAKNLLVGDSITYERKIREIVVASRIEKEISKQQILEIYLNLIYLGRSSWGVDLASRAYFGKPISQVSITEGAFLAGLTKGPAYFNPDRYRDRAQGRLEYVLTRMQEDGAITMDQFKKAQAERLTVAANSRLRRTTGFHLVDEVAREARSVVKIGSLTTNSYEIRSTIRPELQRAAEAAMQEGLARYEQNAGRVDFRGPETNIGDAVKALTADPKADRSKPAWQFALGQARLPLYDVHWTPAVVVEKVIMKGGHESIRVGLPDGRTFPISTWGTRTRSRLAMHDVVYVKVIENSNKQGTRVELRSRPSVQGATVVVENKTGRILAMVGGFSYPLSQLNRVTQSRRQPGSSFKPLVYLAALNSGLQPNTLVEDAPLTYPPIGGANRYTRDKDWWSPSNYDGGYSGTMTLRRALEQSKNLATARLLDGGISYTPQDSLNVVCKLAQEAQVYNDCMPYYPFVLGAQPARLVDLAGFYAAIANEGLRPTPHVIEQISQDGKTVYSAPEQLKPLSVDRAAVFQLRSLLQGVVARGTAARISALSSYVAGKTGTSDEFNDVWFAGFNSDVTIIVWVGYDNAKGKRTLGQGNAGSKVALPIFDQINQAYWAIIAPRTVLPGPTRETARRLVAVPIDGSSGERLEMRGQGGMMEYFRLGPDGRPIDSQYRLSSSSEFSVGGNYDNGYQPFSGGFPFFFGNSGSGRDFFGPTNREFLYGNNPRRDYDGTPTRPRQVPQSRSYEANPDDELRYLRPPRPPEDVQPQRRLQPPAGGRRAEPGYIGR